MERAKKYYGEEYGGIKRLKSGHSQLVTLDDLYKYLCLAWWQNTAHPMYQREWVPTNPSFGQSAVTSILVYDLFGGTLHSVPGRRGADHYFNCLNAHVIDLTWQQFYMDEWPISYEPNQVTDRDHIIRSGDTYERYRRLIDRMADIVKENI